MNELFNLKIFYILRNGLMFLLFVEFGYVVKVVRCIIFCWWNVIESVLRIIFLD